MSTGNLQRFFGLGSVQTAPRPVHGSASEPDAAPDMKRTPASGHLLAVRHFRGAASTVVLAAAVTLAMGSVEVIASATRRSLGSGCSRCLVVQPQGSAGPRRISMERVPGMRESIRRIRNPALCLVPDPLGSGSATSGLARTDPD